MSRLLQFYKAGGGRELLIKYVKNKVLLYSVFIFFIVPKNKRGMEQFREIVDGKIYLKLKKKYKKVIKKTNYNITKADKPKIIWFCWFQGLQNAPKIVLESLKTIKRNLPDYDIRIITKENLNKYAELPEFIYEKWNKGIITNTHFSDILRVNLLFRYGGFWIDSTCVLTNRIPEDIEKADLFLFRNFKPASDGHVTNVSSWFLSSCKGHAFFQISQNILFDYWKRHNYLCDYFFIFYIFQMVMEIYPVFFQDMPRYPIETPHFLFFELGNNITEDKIYSYCSQTFIHKLSYKLTVEKEQEIEKVFKYLN